MKVISSKIIICIFLITLSACSARYSVERVSPFPPPVKTIENINVALVLGGGGAKGIAHVAVLEVLEENNIPVDLIVGSSAGSAVGALYADIPDANLLKSKLMGINKWDVLDISMIDAFKMLFDIKGPIRGYYYENFLHKNLRTKNIEDLKIPLVIVTTDIGRNQIYSIRSGDIAAAVHASSAIPLIFTPVKMYERTLVDGAVLEPVPVTVARKFNPKLVISVDICSAPELGTPGNMLDLTYKSLSLYYHEFSRLKASESDVDIHPDLDGFSMFDSNQLEMYKRGREAALDAVPKIKQLMKKRNIKEKPKTTANSL